jgi:hypothetical protein
MIVGRIRALVATVVLEKYTLIKAQGMTIEGYVSFLSSAEGGSLGVGSRWAPLKRLKNQNALYLRPDLRENG